MPFSDDDQWIAEPLVTAYSGALFEQSECPKEALVNWEADRAECITRTGP